MIKPNFLCIGAQKAGTTTLHDILNQHPDIYLPDLKEAHYFDQENRYKNGLEWWINTFFKSYKNEKIMGAMTPEYLYYNEVAERILNELGKDIKIIIILRNPVDRAYSHYLMSVRRGFETMSFNQAIDSEPGRIQCSQFNNNHFSYITRGLYSRQILRYINRFPIENILFLSFENDIVKNIDTTITKIEDFLGVDKLKLNTELKSNPASEPRFKFINSILYNPSMFKKIFRPILRSQILNLKIARIIDVINQKPTLKKQLLKEDKSKIMDKYFSRDIVRLEKILNKSFEYWKCYE